MTLPFLQLPHLGPDVHAGGMRFGPFFWVLTIGVACGAAVTRRYARRLGVPDDDRRWLGAILAFAALVGAHLYDVAFYGRERASEDPSYWYRLTDGISAFGGIAGVVVALVLVARRRRLDLRVYADLVAAGAVVALALGRVGCALVHDHPGMPTTLPTGVDYPMPHAAWALHRSGLDEHVVGDVIRLHDLGLYELVLLIPVVAVTLRCAFGARPRLPAGALAAGVAIAYAVLRLGLDLLRLPATEPEHAGLRPGTWGALATLAIALYLLRRVRRGPPAPLAAELDGAPGGRLPDLAPATVRT